MKALNELSIAPTRLKNGNTNDNVNVNQKLKPNESKSSTRLSNRTNEDDALLLLIFDILSIFI